MATPLQGGAERHEEHGNGNAIDNEVAGLVIHNEGVGLVIHGAIIPPRLPCAPGVRERRRGTPRRRLRHET
jgi:hypothetical protein